MNARLLIVVLCLGFGAVPTAADAADAYVVAADKASVGIAAAVKRADTLRVGPDGHIVLMTGTGEFVYRAGPFGGPAAELLGPGDPNRASLQANEINSLLALARTHSKAPRAAAVQTVAADATPFPPDERRISIGVRVYCRVAGTTPLLVAPRKFRSRVRLVVRRQSKPKRVLRAVWPAGAKEMPWPGDTPAFASGYFVWTVGYLAAQGVRIKEVPLPPTDLARRAATFERAGCQSQALVAFRKALALARRE